MLKTETNHLKEINEHYKIEIKNTNINYAKDKAELFENLEAKTIEVQKIEKTHNILKDLYETQILLQKHLKLFSNQY